MTRDSQRAQPEKHTDTDLLLSPTAAADQYLRVPEIEKNFLLSPPGSPPLDWTQERESAPFTGSHSAVLDSVTRELRLDGFSLGGDPVLGSSTDLLTDSKLKPGNTDCQPAASSDGTRLVLDFGSYAVPSKSGAVTGKKNPLMSSDSLMSDSSNNDNMDRNVSVVSLPMVIVENMDGETIDAGTWSGTGLPKDPIPKTCAPPRWS